MRLIVVALEDEFDIANKPNGYNVIFTGIGKVNAAMTLARYLTVNPHVEAVYNYGTAGAVDRSVAGELLEVGAVLERDMDLTALDVDRFCSDDDQEPLMYTANRNSDIICGTGDQFARPEDPYHIVDMEAFALAKVCKAFTVPFYCYKYISDTSEDEDPANEWKKHVAKGQKKFLKVLT